MKFIINVTKILLRLLLKRTFYNIILYEQIYTERKVKGKRKEKRIKNK
jgi:hypothetical protein